MPLGGTTAGVAGTVLAAISLDRLSAYLMLAGVWLGLITLYFTPAIVAYARGHDRQKFIFYLNLLGGWTVMGWLIAGLWSVTVIDRRYAKPPFWDKPRRKQQDR